LMGSLSRPIRAGVIGVGQLGQHHARVFSELRSTVEFVGVADIDAARASEIAKRVGTEAFPDFHPLLERVDAVSIAVPTRYHHFVCRACIQRGIHVLVEKPMAASLAQADDLLELAARHKVIIQVGHIERFNTAIRALMNMKVDPLFMEVHRLGPFSPRTADVSVVFDLMIHDLDIVLELKGRAPVRVEAVGTPVLSENIDIATARLEFDDGSLANLTASRVTREKMRKIRVFGRDSYVTVDCIKQDIAVLRLKPGAAGGEWTDRLAVERPELARGEPLKLEIESFIRCVAEGGEPDISGVKGREAMAVAARIDDDMAVRIGRFRAGRAA